jgi:hypothetical protein
MKPMQLVKRGTKKSPESPGKDGYLVTTLRPFEPRVLKEEKPGSESHLSRGPLTFRHWRRPTTRRNPWFGKKEGVPERIRVKGAMVRADLPERQVVFRVAR